MAESQWILSAHRDGVNTIGKNIKMMMSHVKFVSFDELGGTPSCRGRVCEALSFRLQVAYILKIMKIMISENHQ